MNLNHKLIEKSTINNLNYLSSNNAEFQNIYVFLKNNYETCLIGGAIRDFSKDKKPNDLDFVVNTSEDTLLNLLEKYNFSINAFGGYKVHFESFDLDIWTYNSHWAFKNKILDTTTENLQCSTFFNIDSLVFNINSKKLYSDYFIKGFQEKCLDITIDDKYFVSNPNPTKNVYKALCLANEWGWDFSNRTKHYISTWKKTCTLDPITEIKNYELRQDKNISIVEKYKDFLVSL